jgi:hypothetical protein
MSETRAVVNTIGGLGLAACLLAAVAIGGCGKKEVAPLAPPPVSMTVEQGFEAFFRGHRAIKICYESVRDAWLLYYKEPPETKDDYTGWYFVEKVPFYYMQQNNTWFMTDLAADKYVKVYPDVTGLQCKDKAQ